MKTISVSENLHKWIMDHKNSERTSAEKVIFALIGKIDFLKEQLNLKEDNWEELGGVAAGIGNVTVHHAHKRNRS